MRNTFHLPLLLFLFISLSPWVSSAQNSEEFFLLGDDFYQEGKYLESAQAYEKAFALSDGSATQHYNAACSWALSGDTLSAMNQLRDAADLGWMNAEHLQKDSDLSSLHDIVGWQDVLDRVRANLADYEKDFNQPLKAQLEEIYLRDQMLRQLYQEAEEKFGRDSEEMDYFWSLVSEQDSLNEKEVCAIIEEEGWVGKSLVGGKANMTLWLVIQHAPLETQEKYLPLLRQSVLDGESSGSHLALLEDRIQMRKGLPQTYGSQITRDEESGEQMVYEIRDPEYVDQRRKAVGLGPLADYVQKWGIEWTVEQLEK